MAGQRHEYVLVHGGWHGGWCWREVARLLRVAGHEVWAPVLTGLGERAHLLDPRIDLDTHVQDVTATLEMEDLREVILVGHSYGGMVITGVAGRGAARLGQLVYLDAFLPLDGEALLDLLRPERRSLYLQAAQTVGDGWRVPAPPVAAFGVTDAAQAGWVAARLTEQPLGTFRQPVRCTDPAAEALPRTYIRCTTGPLVPSFTAFAERVRGAPGWRYHELATGHDAMLTAPREVAGLLLALA